MKDRLVKTHRKINKKVAKGIIIALIAILSVVVFFAVWFGIELAININRYASPARKPKDEAAYNVAYGKISNVIWVLENPHQTNSTISYTSDTLTEAALNEALSPFLDWINHQYDCSDFRLFRVMRLAYALKNYIGSAFYTKNISDSLKYTLLNARYWLDEMGNDSACYHSENHQIAYFVMAYLASKLYPNETFVRSNLQGTSKSELSRTRILEWLSLRSKYGFSEFNSSNYLPVDFEAISLLIAFGDSSDTLLMTSAQCALDLLCLDYALSYSQGTGGGAQGRAYPVNNMQGKNNETETSEQILGAIFATNPAENAEYKATNHGSSFCKIIAKGLYSVPEAIKLVGDCTENQVIKTASGLNLNELENEGLLGTSDKQIMMQFGMGALSNPEVVNNTLKILDKYSLYSNDFFTSFKYMNISWLKWTGVNSKLSSCLNLFSNGMALEKANVYTYKTASYKLSSLQNYNVGSCGAQQTTMQAILEGGVPVYTTNPLREDTFTTSPGYWAGYGVAPHTAKYEIVCIMLYQMPNSKPAFSPSEVLNYTHTYFPTQLFDEYIVEGKYAFARVGNSLLAIIGASDFVQVDYNAEKATALQNILTDTTKCFELIQKGKNQFTIYETSTLAKEGALSTFASRIKANTLTYNDKSALSYSSFGKTYNLSYKGNFAVDGVVQSCDYARYESKYVNVDYLSEDIEVFIGGHSLKINIKNGTREIA